MSPIWRIKQQTSGGQTMQCYQTGLGLPASVGRRHQNQYFLVKQQTDPTLWIDQPQVCNLQLARSLNIGMSMLKYTGCKSTKGHSPNAIRCNHIGTGCILPRRNAIAMRCGKSSLSSQSHATSHATKVANR